MGKSGPQDPKDSDDERENGSVNGSLPILQLPRKVVFHILSWIQPADIACLALTCRTFYHRLATAHKNQIIWYRSLRDSVSPSPSVGAGGYSPAGLTYANILSRSLSPSPLQLSPTPFSNFEEGTDYRRQALERLRSSGFCRQCIGTEIVYNTFIGSRKHAQYCKGCFDERYYSLQKLVDRYPILRHSNPRDLPLVVVTLSHGRPDSRARSYVRVKDIEKIIKAEERKLGENKPPSTLTLRGKETSAQRGPQQMIGAEYKSSELVAEAQEFIPASVSEFGKLSKLTSAVEHYYNTSLRRFHVILHPESFRDFFICHLSSSHPTLMGKDNGFTGIIQDYLNFTCSEENAKLMGIKLVKSIFAASDDMDFNLCDAVWPEFLEHWIERWFKDRYSYHRADYYKTSFSPARSISVPIGRVLYCHLCNRGPFTPSQTWGDRSTYSRWLAAHLLDAHWEKPGLYGPWIPRIGPPMQPSDNDNNEAESGNQMFEKAPGGY